MFRIPFSIRHGSHNHIRIYEFRQDYLKKYKLDFFKVSYYAVISMPVLGVEATAAAGIRQSQIYFLFYPSSL